MDNNDKVLEAIAKMSKSSTEFGQVLNSVSDKIEAKDGFGAVKTLILAAKKARKLADDLLVFSDSVEDMFGL